MDHKRGKDPTPAGRTPLKHGRADQAEPQSEVEAKYQSSAPGPDQLKDGAAFFGYKRENAYPSNPSEQP